MITTKVQLPSTASSLKELVHRHHLAPSLCSQPGTLGGTLEQGKSGAGSRGTRTWFLPLQLCAGETVEAHSSNTHRESGPVLVPSLL